MAEIATHMRFRILDPSGSVLFESAHPIMESAQFPCYLASFTFPIFFHWRVDDRGDMRMIQLGDENPPNRLYSLALRFEIEALKRAR